MQAIPSPATRVYEQSAPLLLISGVKIPQDWRAATEGRPTPDYGILLDQFKPDVIDIDNIAHLRVAWDKLAERAFGMTWVIAIAAFLRRHKYQAFIATGEDVGLPLALMLKLTRSRTPLIMACHNIGTRRPTFFLRRLRVGSAISMFQCLSQSQVEILQERAGNSAKHIQMLYWHVDHHFFRPMPEVTVHNQICSAGMAYRDYATLVTATRDVDVDVKIAADSAWYHQALNIDVQTLPERVEARSYGNYVALRQLYAESKIVVVPLVDVNFSAGYTVILEAMAMGKPVIVTRIRQRDDFIIDGWNGLYVQPGDVDDMRKKIQFLLEHPEEMRRIGQNARRTVEERFTLDHYGQRMRSAVNEVLEASEKK